MHTAPSLCMTPHKFWQAEDVLGDVSGGSWVVAQGIRGVFREVASTEFGLRTYSVPAQTGGSTNQNQCRIYL